MCNHYRSDPDWRERMDDWSETKVRIRFDTSGPRPNIQAADVFPGYVGEIVAEQDGALVAQAATWRLVPFWYRKSLKDWARTNGGCNNARGEAADTNGIFKHAAKSGRCLIPGDAFFEWDDGPKGGKTEYRFAFADGRPFFFAGLASRANPEEGPVLTYTIVTKAAGGDTASIGHPRQPIILRPDELDAWMDPLNPVAAFTERLDPAGTFAMNAAKAPKALAPA